jgi:hypothetical protein
MQREAVSQMIGMKTDPSLNSQQITLQAVKHHSADKQAKAKLGGVEIDEFVVACFPPAGREVTSRARSPTCVGERARATPGPGYGSCHCWLEVSAQAQICSWVPEPP